MIVVIAAFNRPEFLSICLEHVLNADNADKNQYLFALDFGYDAKNLEIINAFPLQKTIIETEQTEYTGGKLSYSVASALIYACKFNELVCYLEDDIIIGQDFFTFAEQVHEQEPDIFEIILSRNMNSIDNVTDNENLYYIKENTNDHQFYGNVFKSELLLKYLEPHCNNDYFTDTTKYVSEHFPDTLLDNGFSELDGLVRRIIEKEHLKVAFAHVPRCFHAGFYGCHRMPVLDWDNMTFADKVKAVREYAFDALKLAEIVTNENYIKDSLPINLKTKHRL